MTDKERAELDKKFSEASRRLKAMTPAEREALHEKIRNIENDPEFQKQVAPFRVKPTWRSWLIMFD